MKVGCIKSSTACARVGQVSALLVDDGAQMIDVSNLWRLEGEVKVRRMLRTEKSCRVAKVKMSAF